MGIKKQNGHTQEKSGFRYQWLAIRLGVDISKIYPPRVHDLEGIISRLSLGRSISTIHFDVAKGEQPGSMKGR